MYPCILFALRREAQPFYRHFRQRRRLWPAPCPAWLCGDSLGRVLVLETGVGPECSARALRWLMDSYLPGERFLRPLFMVSAGFAGGLQPRCHIGDVVVATAVVDAANRRWPCDPGLTATKQGRMDWMEGAILSGPCLIGDPAEKTQLGQRFDALAVDMESAFVAALCAERQIPFACVRSISDEVGKRLSPRLLALLNGGQVRVPRVLTALARSPRLLLELWRLARDTRQAGNQLALVLARLVGAEFSRPARVDEGWCGLPNGCDRSSLPR
jgi:adenosylhomocysteine nucleosidase